MEAEGICICAGSRTLIPVNSEQMLTDVKLFTEFNLDWNEEACLSKFLVQFASNISDIINYYY